VSDRTRSAITSPAVVEFLTTAAAGALVGAALYWFLLHYGVLLMPNPEAAPQVFSP
jgi:hypothetical protein